MTRTEQVFRIVDELWKTPRGRRVRHEKLRFRVTPPQMPGVDKRHSSLIRDLDLKKSFGGPCPRSSAISEEAKGVQGARLVDYSKSLRTSAETVVPAEWHGRYEDGMSHTKLLRSKAEGSGHTKPLSRTRDIVNTQHSEQTVNTTALLYHFGPLYVGDEPRLHRVHSGIEVANVIELCLPYG